ncbi:bin amphiphysin rvs domain for vesicular trafficking [Pyricularia oryzae]|nr:bin amphiphysin rvs domain for vesicular trafficking [Pyricularia oryzae]KAI7932773.1 bin amphiphysin rvs domain for vesicular trafficking [Pyricularia oryzae]QBZ56322.1 hypothetical protein PoMZ_01228 [Pyricularia oryzae]
MDFKNFGKNITSLGASFTPFASRTFQYTKEQLGQVEDKTQLPPDYIDLEKRVDALKAVHQKMLAVTNQYATEAYDYPPNIKETFSDLGRTVSEKVTLLSSATSPAEAQAALTAPPSAKPQPKTFSHAIARASLASSQTLHQTHADAGEDPLATALEKYALAQERVGEARLAQDNQIQRSFLAGWNTTLNTNLLFATRARKNVENSRLSLDAAKARAKGTTWKLPATTSPRGDAAAHHEEPELSPEAQEEIEKAEDEFVTQTEEAVGVMKNVLDTPEPLRNLAELVAAQMEYHKKAHEILSELAPLIEGLQLPLGLLNAAQGHAMMVELKNGETLNGHLVQCDTWMNLTLREVVQTSPDGDKFMRLPEIYVKGNNIKYLRVPDEVIDQVKEQQQQHQQQHQQHGQQGGFRGGRGGGSRGDHRGGGDRGRGGRGRGAGRGRGRGGA